MWPAPPVRLPTGTGRLRQQQAARDPTRSEAPELVLIWVDVTDAVPGKAARFVGVIPGQSRAALRPRHPLGWHVDVGVGRETRSPQVELVPCWHQRTRVDVAVVLSRPLQEEGVRCG